MKAVEIAAKVRSGELSASSVVQSSLALIGATDPKVNAFTAVLAERALKRAGQIDKHTRRAELSLAGVPFAVKNLFDIAGLPTLFVYIVAGKYFVRGLTAGAVKG